MATILMEMMSNLKSLRQEGMIFQISELGQNRVRKGGIEAKKASREEGAQW